MTNPIVKTFYHDPNSTTKDIADILYGWRFRIYEDGAVDAVFDCYEAITPCYDDIEDVIDHILGCR